MTLLEQLTLNTAPGPEYEPDQPALLEGLGTDQLPVRLIAFYLPQFHPIPENDLWWGKGFTEWTNVSKALPRFAGHYQPHLPGELGFYDLRSTDALRAQAALARRYGVHGFCFHYYWFGGKRLLETPLHNLLQAPDINLPFCVNWANENWSRRWDGFETDILMAQQHSPEDDLAFAAALLPVFADPRYIRIDGRPLLMLYRPGILPEAAATVNRWRAFFREHGEADPYITMVQGFDDGDPRRYGMDAAVGFPPHHGGWDAPLVTGTVELLDERYRGRVVRYEDAALRTLANRMGDYKLLPGVCPGWDNEARKPGRGFTFIGSTPARYGAWLEAACHQATKHTDPDERIVFINAWNEWAEGAHLEPDRHFGYAYLAETARVLARLASGSTAASSEDLAATLQASPEAPRGAGAGLARFKQRVTHKVADLLEKAANALRS